MDITRTPDGLRAGSTPLARSARRAPDTPNIRPSDGPLRSASTAPTASPLAARAAARLAVMALLPTPPLPLAMATTDRTKARRSARRWCWSSTCSSRPEPVSCGTSW